MDSPARPAETTAHAFQSAEVVASFTRSFQAVRPSDKQAAPNPDPALIMMESVSILWRPGQSRCDKDRGQTFSGRGGVCFGESSAPAARADTAVSKHQRAEPVGRGGSAVISLVVGSGGVYQVGRHCLSLPVHFYLRLDEKDHIR